MKKLITSALPYVNNVPHLGNLIQVLSADVFARFCRLRGYETLYVCGTDEYGTATETKAQIEGITPRELCDRFHALHAHIYNWFGISFDYFGRTSDELHTGITQEIFLDLQKNGFISEQETEQLYCEHCARFLADRFVVGTCPRCGYSDARGDQCEICGSLLEPTELKDPHCSVCSHEPHPKKTKHLYINLPGILSQYQAWMNQASLDGRWANNAIQMTKSWIRDGLKERAITRDLKWGIPVPKEGYENKVFYVWFDAPIGYVSITQRWAHIQGKNWKDWWLDRDDVQLFQFIGKDNIPFHTVIFPSTLIGTGKQWTKLYHMSSTEYLNYEAGKFSKSKGIGVFGTDAKESGIPADIWRFYIFYNRPEKSDTTFTWKDFQEKVNSELIGNLCNLVNRSFSFIVRNFGGTVLEPTQAVLDTIKNERMREQIHHLRAAITEAKERIAHYLDWADLKEAFQEVFRLSALANKAFQELEPWKTVKTDKEETCVFLSELCYYIKDLMIMAHPYIPAYCSKVADFCGLTIWSGDVFDEQSPQSTGSKSGLTWAHIGERTGIVAVQNPEIIFKTFDDKTISDLRERYSGVQGNSGASVKPVSKKEDTSKNTSANNAAPTIDCSPTEYFSKTVSLKVAKIVSIEKHPDADKLYVEKLDDGSGTERTIVSGLVPFYAAEELLGRHVIIADNLKPRKMRGILSQGMLLAASVETADGEVVEVLTAPDVAPGTRLVLEGMEETAVKPEISADEFFAVEMSVKNFEFQLDSKRFTVAGKVIRTEKIADGTVG